MSEKIPETGLSLNALQAPFRFQPRSGGIDWRKIVSIDVNQVISDVDIDTLQDVLESLVFSDVKGEKFEGPEFVKIFQLAQLTLEYLCHIQESLTQDREHYQDQMLKIRSQVEERDNELNTKDEEIRALKKELKRLKSSISVYEFAITQQQQQSGVKKDKDSVVKCPFCSKMFLSTAFLSSHILRRHPEHSEYVREQLQSEEKAKKEKVQTEERRKDEEVSTIRGSVAEELRSVIAEEMKKLQSVNDDVRREVNSRIDVEKERLAALQNREMMLEKDHSEHRVRVEQQLIRLQDTVKKEMDEISDRLINMAQSASKNEGRFGSMEEDVAEPKQTIQYSGVTAVEIEDKLQKMTEKFMEKVESVADQQKEENGKLIENKIQNSESSLRQEFVNLLHEMKSEQGKKDEVERQQRMADLENEWKLVSTRQSVRGEKKVRSPQPDTPKEVKQPQPVKPKEPQKPKQKPKPVKKPQTERPMVVKKSTDKLEKIEAIDTAPDRSVPQRTDNKAQNDDETKDLDSAREEIRRTFAEKMKEFGISDPEADGIGSHEYETAHTALVRKRGDSVETKMAIVAVEREVDEILQEQDHVESTLGQRNTGDFPVRDTKRGRSSSESKDTSVHSGLSGKLEDVGERPTSTDIVSRQTTKDEVSVGKSGGSVKEEDNVEVEFDEVVDEAVSGGKEDVVMDIENDVKDEVEEIRDVDDEVESVGDRVEIIGGSKGKTVLKDAKESNVDEDDDMKLSDVEEFDDTERKQMTDSVDHTRDTSIALSDMENTGDLGESQERKELRQDSLVLSDDDDTLDDDLEQIEM